MKRIGILTSGGDAPGMNAAIRSAVRTVISKGGEALGIDRGYAGLLAEEIQPLAWKDVGGIVTRGGTILKTARCPAFMEKDVQRRAAEILAKYDVGGLLVIGGDGSMAGAAALESLGVMTAVIPGTIDNDMCGTEETIGYDTAVNTVLDAMRRIRDTAASHDRAAVIEVMGRHSGRIALASGLAGGAEFTVVPEVDFSINAIADGLLAMQKEGRTNSLIVCAEGAMDGKVLSDQLKARTHMDICTTILGYIQRGGAPTARDAYLGAILGAAAADELLAGRHGFLAGMKGSRVHIVSYGDAFGEKKSFDETSYDLSLRIGAGMDIRH